MPEQEDQTPLNQHPLSLQVRTGKNGSYVKIHAHEFEQGISVALENGCPEIQLTGPVGTKKSIPDFKLLEPLSRQLTSIVFYGFNVVEKVHSFESIYSLKNIRRISFQEKQRFAIDLTRFPELTHFGAQYWKGINSIFDVSGLQSLVLSEYPGKDLSAFALLTALETLHLYRSKTEDLNGIEALSALSELNLSRNTSLVGIADIAKAEKLRHLHIEKCPKLGGLDILQLPPASIKATLDGKPFPGLKH